ncbi:MAG: hypothetical protein M0Z42_19525 [Actinomycetota bacterium]|nr:hypothetical protein [Actinomycetota bacterium]
MSEQRPSDPAGMGAHQAQSGPTDPWRPPISARRSAATAAPLAMLGLLAIQFLLGMAVNLYVKLPSAGGAMTEMMGSGPLVMIHMMLGVFVAAGAVVAVAAGIPFGRRAVSCAAIALASIFAAGLGGLLFLMDGQSNGASYLMAVGFLVAVAGYVTEVITFS